MSFIDTLKALFGVSAKKENEENIIVASAPVVEQGPGTHVQDTQTPIEEIPEERIVTSQPGVYAMENDVVSESPVVEAPVETVTDSVISPEN